MSDDRGEVSTNDDVTSGQRCSACGATEKRCWENPTSCCDTCRICAGFTHDGGDKDWVVSP